MRVIVVLGALVALGPLRLGPHLPALPRITDELVVSSSTTQLTLTATLAGLALGQLMRSTWPKRRERGDQDVEQVAVLSTAPQVSLRAVDLDERRIEVP